MKRISRFLIAALGLVPCVALADVGTSLVWATGFHMVFGNALLGLLEGWLLAKAFSLRRGRCVALMVLANYSSAWLGMFIVAILRASQTVDIYNALRKRTISLWDREHAPVAMESKERMSIQKIHHIP